LACTARLTFILGLTRVTFFSVSFFRYLYTKCGLSPVYSSTVS
jgi:hypothetical protein